MNAHRQSNPVPAGSGDGSSWWEGDAVAIPQRTSLLRTCWYDLAAAAEMTRAPFPSPKGLANVLTLTGTWAVLLFRLSAACRRCHLGVAARLLQFANVMAFGADLHPGADIGPGLAIMHPVGVTISRCMVGRRLRVAGHITIGGGGFVDPRRDGFPTVGDGCWLFDGSKILGPVTVGDGCIIGANALVRNDLPARVIAVGSPARVLRHRDDLTPATQPDAVPPGPDTPEAGQDTADLATVLPFREAVS